MDYKKPDVRRKQILNAAVKLSRKGSYLTITRDKIARESRVSPALISHYFKTMYELRIEVMNHAVKYHDLIILAQGLSHGNFIARGITDDLKSRVGKYISK